MKQARQRRTNLIRWVLLALPAVLALVAGLRPAAPAAAAFPGANGKIVFTSTRPNNYEIYVMNSDGGNPTRLTNHIGDDQDPVWSPDGSKIAFVSTRDGNFEIYVMNADGSGQTRLTNQASLDLNPTWSPDGSKIAFDTHRDGNLEIYVMNADGSGQTRLTNHSAHDDHPAWSPDGTKIVFRSVRDNDYELYSMNVNGSGQTRLTTSPQLDSEPSWSPDGTKIAFTSFRDGNSEVYVMNADGSNPTRLTTNPESDGSPAWSADGTKIVFSSIRVDADTPITEVEIYVMNANGSSQTRITTSPGFDLSPDWQPIAAATIYASPSATGTTSNGITATPQDILRYDQATGTWSMFFDGSTVGVTKALSGFARRSDGSLLLSFQANQNLPGLGKVTPWDVVRYLPSSNVFQWWVDGSDVGLSAKSEKIDALEELPNGRVLISTTGNVAVPKQGGGTLKAQDEDVVAFIPSATGTNTSGTWVLHFDGTAVPGLSAEDVIGVSVDATGSLFVSLDSGYSVQGLTGGPKDVLRLRPSGNGFSVLRMWRGTPHGFDLNLSGIELEN